jgi:hypothetical protein
MKSASGFGSGPAQQVGEDERFPVFFRQVVQGALQCTEELAAEKRVSMCANVSQTVVCL